MTERKSGEMSMEDILSSIRKYVSEEGGAETVGHEIPEDPHDDDEIRLGAEQVVNHAVDEVYSDTPRLVGDLGGRTHARVGPFDKLTDALKAYGRHGKSQPRGDSQQDSMAAIHHLFTTIASDIISQWIERNLPRITEELVMREIERLKS
jgi:cell pole-organizing protein PopZ